jgi:hypothetical protein
MATHKDHCRHGMATHKDRWVLVGRHSMAAEGGGGVKSKKQKKGRAGRRWCCLELGDESAAAFFERLLFREIALAYTTDGTYPIVGNVFEGSAGSNAAVGIAYLRVVDVTTYIAYILLHDVFILLIYK